jgi:hypothetical protein
MEFRRAFKDERGVIFPRPLRCLRAEPDGRGGDRAVSSRQVLVETLEQGVGLQVRCTSAWHSQARCEDGCVASRAAVVLVWQTSTPRNERFEWLATANRSGWLAWRTSSSAQRWRGQECALSSRWCWSTTSCELANGHLAQLTTSPTDECSEQARRPTPGQHHAADGGGGGGGVGAPPPDLCRRGPGSEALRG